METSKNPLLSQSVEAVFSLEKVKAPTDGMLFDGRQAVIEKPKPRKRGRPATLTPEQREAADVRHASQTAEAINVQRTAAREIPPLPAVVQPRRRSRCRRDLKRWLTTYCKPAVHLGWSGDHLELIAALQDILLYGGQLAIGMPRGTGKSTIVSLSLLWSVLYGHHRFLVLIAANDGKARKGLEALKMQIGSNPVLMADFPEVCLPVRCLGGVTNRQAGQTLAGERTRISWGKEELIFPSVAGSVSSGTVVLAGGITSAITRGPVHTLPSGEIIRPTVVLLDDFQTRESAKSLSQVQDRLDIIEGDVAGMAGPRSGLAMLATGTVIYTDDGADQLLDRDLNPDWNGIRKKFLLRFPDDLRAPNSLWIQYSEIRRDSLRTYRDIRTATAFYAANREQMDAGAEVSWKKRFRQVRRKVDGKEIDVREISAIQHAMEWYLVKPRAFAAELQNEPIELAVSSRGWLSAKAIEARTSGLPRRSVPQAMLETSQLVAHIDVHDDLLYWSLGACAADGSVSVIDYGTYPDQKLSYFRKEECKRTLSRLHRGLGLDGAIRAGLLSLASELLAAEYTGEDGAESYSVGLLLMDCGHKLTLIQSVVRELLRERENRDRISMMRGFGVRAADTPLAERKQPRGTRRYNHAWRPMKKGRLDARRLNVDVNYWKAELQTRWATGTGEPGCLTLWTPGPRDNHQLFAEHQKAEQATENTARGRTVLEFRPVVADNHWLDTMVGVLVGSAVMGCDTPAHTEPAPPAALDTAAEQRQKVQYL